MRQRLLEEGVGELSYEIRGIVEKALTLERHGRQIRWENIGDPVAKGAELPGWMKELIAGLVADDKSYGYCHSMGTRSTREFLAARTNRLGGAQITADDVLFFNGLGDAISTLYGLLAPEARVIVPSPVYSTHSSAEGAHARSEPITFRLDPARGWQPDLDDLHAKVRDHPEIVGLLLINPDNPTGMIYPRATLERIVEIAEEFDLLVIADEIYWQITYGGARSTQLAEVIGERPGIAMKGISKDLP